MTTPKTPATRSSARTPRTRYTGPDHSPGFLLWRVTLSWQRAMRSALASHDLTHVQFVLLASVWWLDENSGSAPTQAMLAQQVGTDPMMTSQVIRKLEQRGLITRTADPQDARARRLALTAAGRKLAARALADVEAADEHYFAPLGRRRTDFVAALSALDAPPPPSPR